MAGHKPEDIHRRFAEAFNAGDLASLTALYEPEARLAPQPGQVVVGPEAIRDALQGFLALRGHIRLDTQYVIEAGELALLRAQWHLTGTGPDGTPVDMQGNSTEVVRRQGDGRWCYIIDHPFGAD
jgi:uncharacterized protein (TIGR02246 family)